MKHITVDEIIRFVSLTELNDEAVALAADVNAHIAGCDKCLELVNAFQLIYDEFITLNKQCDFKEHLTDVIEKRYKTNETAQSALEELEM